jgi:hypothetical protein
VRNPRAATGQWACGFGVKVPRGHEKICATRWSPIFLLMINDRYHARFTPKPGPISQSPRYDFLFEFESAGDKVLDAVEVGSTLKTTGAQHTPRSGDPELCVRVG